MKIVLGLSLVSLSLSVAAEQVFVSTTSSGSIDVPAGETRTQTDRVSVQDGGSLYKTGKGTLVLSGKTVLQNNPLTMGVRQGEVRLTADGAAPDETADDAAALSTMSNAAFWVRADAASGMVVTGANFVAQWRDVREGAVTDPAAAHTYPYALPKWDDKLSTSALYGKPPVYSATGAGGNPAVYFGGFYSSQKMWWYTAAGAEWKLSGIRNAFIVQYVDKSHGFAVMARNGQNADFHVGGTSGSTGNTLWVDYSGDGRAMHDASRTFLNGTYVDGTVERVPVRSTFLLDVRFLSKSANAGAFFTDRDIGKRAGGDYLSEALVFTNQLTDAECEKISRYLLRRYGVAATPAVSFSLATGTVVSCSVPQGETMGSGMGISGYGFLTKSGAGSVFLSYQHDPFEGAYRLEDGTIGLRAMPNYAPASGEDVRVAADETQDVGVTKTTGADGTFVKRGSGAIRVSEIPETVSHVRVEEGELILTAPAAGSGVLRSAPVAGSGATGVFTNGDFTAMQTAFPDSGQVWLLYASGGKDNTEFGWTAFRNDDWIFSPEVFYVNYDKFDGGKNGKWPSGGVAPPKSRCFLSIKGDSTAESKFVVPEAGAYVLSFYAQGRFGRASESHSPVDVQIGPDADHLTTLATLLTASEDKWKLYELDTGWLEPGTNVIRLATQTTGKDDCTSFADFALTQSATYDPSVAYRIPNGDFEWFDYSVTDLASFTTNQTLRGWTFEQGTYYDTYPNATHPGIGACCNGVALQFVCLACDAFYGSNRSRLAFFDNKGSYAETTFTPPAGTYHLRGEMRRYSGYWCSYTGASGNTYSGPRNVPKVEARVTIGGVTTVLGTNTTSRQIMTQLTWNNSFTVDGTQAVTLRLTNVQSTGSGAIDNLVLLSDAAGGELVRNGTFDTASDWTWTKHADATVPGLALSSASRMTRDSFNTANWSSDLSVGSYFARICQRGEMSQEIFFPVVGSYRLAFGAHSRPDGPNGQYVNGQNPIKAFLTKDAQTIDIGWTTVGCTNYIRHVMDFRVPAAGTYTLSLQGLCDGTSGHVWPSGNDQSTLLGDVSVTCIEGAVAERAAIPASTTIDVAANARLRLDFTGTNAVKRVRLGGHGLRGIVNAETCPDYVQGHGTLLVPTVPVGALMLVR